MQVLAVLFLNFTLMRNGYMKSFEMNMRVLTLLLLASGLACAQQGLGHSIINSTGPCLDVDGDGYGVGAGCLGPDADDNDATVHSGSQAIAKYGSINAFLVHLGYQSATSPAPVYCISTTGNDATGARSTNADTACAHPYLTWYPGAYTVFQPAGVPAIILFRSGTYAGSINPNMGGTPSQSVYLMSYPGDWATIDNSAGVGNAIGTVGYPYITVTNLGIKGNASGSGYSGGTYIVYGSGSQAITFVGDKLTYCEIWHSGTDSNVDADNTVNFTVKYNVVHDPYGNGAQHNIYLGSNTVASSGAVVSDNIMYNDFEGGYPNFQFNGRCNGCYFENNWIYNSDQTGMALYNGVSNSFIRNNLVWNTGTTTTGNGVSYSLIMTGSITGQCQVSGLPSICPYDQTGNVIENNTFWSGPNDISTGAANLLGPAIYIGSTTVPPCGTCGTTYGNFFRNNVIVGAGKVNSSTQTGYPTVVYVASGSNSAEYYVGTDTWTDNIFNTQDSSSYILGMGGAQAGYNAYNCASFAAMALSSTGCSTAPAGFTNVSPAYYNAPGSFKFAPQPGSPAIGAGTPVGAPAVDILGNPRANPPAIGAYEPSVQGSGNGPTVSALGCAPASLVSGGTATCTVTLSQAAGAGGATVAIASTSGSLLVPTQVSVAANASTATFTATAGTISVEQTGIVSAALNGSWQGFTFMLAAPAMLSSVSCSPANLASAGTSTCTLTLVQPAGVNVTVPLASNTQTLTVPVSAVVAAGNTTATFSATAGTITAASSATVTATLNGASRVTSISLSPTLNSWVSLSNTMLKSVCPANNFGGIPYAFANYCPNVVNAWSGAAADTKRNRLIIWGGGDSDYQGNEIYSLNLNTTPLTMTRLTDPSAWNYAVSYEVNPDGTPTSRHTYNDLVYLPVQDALYSFGGCLPSGTCTNHTWMFTFADNQWHAKDPANGFDPTSFSNSVTGAACAYDPQHADGFLHRWKY